MKTLKRAAFRKFDITPSEYQLFKFSISRSTTILIRLIATSPVNLLLLDNEDRAEYEGGIETHSYTNSWGRRIDLEEEVQVGSGTWYLVVEGYKEPSSGIVEVYK
jgi:hypothetical protein